MIYSLIQIWYDQTYILSFYLNLKCKFSFFVAFRQTYARLGICRHSLPHIANQTYIWLTSAHISQSPFMSVTLWETSSRERHNTSRVSFKFILNIGVALIFIWDRQIIPNYSNYSLCDRCIYYNFIFGLKSRDRLTFDNLK